jgi:hypothetical protein
MSRQCNAHCTAQQGFTPVSLHRQDNTLRRRSPASRLRLGPRGGAVAVLLGGYAACPAARPPQGCESNTTVAVSLLLRVMPRALDVGCDVPGDGRVGTRRSVELKCRRVRLQPWRMSRRMQDNFGQTTKPRSGPSPRSAVPAPPRQPFEGAKSAACPRGHPPGWFQGRCAWYVCTHRSISSCHRHSRARPPVTEPLSTLKGHAAGSMVNDEC